MQDVGYVQSQDVHIKVESKADFIDSLNSHIDFWKRVMSEFGSYNIKIFGSHTYNANGICQLYIRYITAIINKINSHRKVTKKILNEYVYDYIDSANKMHLIIPEGNIAKHITKDDPNQSICIMILYSKKILYSNNVYSSNFEILWSLISAHPFLEAIQSINNIKDIENNLITQRNLLERILAKSKKRINEMEVFIESLKADIKIKEPTKLWEDIHNKRRKWGIIWGAVFFTLGILPIFFIIKYESIIVNQFNLMLDFNDKSSYIVYIVMFIMPMLFYVWMLKGFSKLMFENLGISTDSQYRKALAATYLSLIKEEECGIDQSERAIILNALFRPPPPGHGEEGPPLGLASLIKENIK